ncbi:MAG: sugar transferase [Candidatus Cloacimonetes bacterium]|nr:sugar transferase [Candidatus Cloacimonadota bacterium]
MQFAIIRDSVSRMRAKPNTISGFFASIIDIFAIYVILCFSFYFRFYAGLIDVTKGIPDFQTYSYTFILIAILFYGIFVFAGQYQKGFRFTPEYSWLLSKNIFYGFLLLTSFAFFYRDFDFSRLTVTISFVFVFVFLNLFSFIKAIFLQAIAPSSFKRNNILIVGTGDRAIEIYKSLKATNQSLNLSVIGPSSIHLPSEINYLGALKSFKTISQEHLINEVIIALEGKEGKKAIEIVEECEQKGIFFSVTPDLFEIVTNKVEIGAIHGVPVVSIGSSHKSTGIQYTLKILMDRILSGVSLIALSPLFFIIYVMIKIEDGGPAFYSQERVGLNGETFNMYKFRSMRTDAEDKSGPTWAVKGDTRWTKAGTFLRKTSIDELPQLWNVLIGQMSLVGARPERPFFVNKFKEQIPGYMVRHRMPVGITGWAQCNGLRGQSSIEDRTTYDLHYVENWSFALDIKILFQTIFKLVFIQSGY